MVDAMEIESTEVDAVSPVDLLQVVADPVRWEILHKLATRPYCVCNLQEHVPIAANLLSYHLKVLREAGLVTSTRRGRWVDYALAENAGERMRAALPGAAAEPGSCAAQEAQTGCASNRVRS